MASPRPRKRPRPAAPPQPLAGWAVALRLSPKAAPRAGIWANHLPMLGASVVRSAADAPRDSVCVVVVTDVPRHARRALRDGFVAVAPAWCEKVLEERRACSVRAFPADLGREGCGGGVLAAVAAVVGEGGGGGQGGDDGCGGGGRRLWQSGAMLRPVWAAPCGELLSGVRRREMAARVPHSLLAAARCNPEFVPHPNMELVAQLQRVGMKRAFTAGDADEGRLRQLAYGRAAAILMVLPFRVVDEEDLRDVYCVKEGVREAVRVFLAHGRVLELDEFATNERLATVDRLSAVYGISITTARKLFEAGVRTVEDAMRYYEQARAVPPTGALMSLRARAEAITYGEAAVLVRRVEAVARAALPEFSLMFKLAGGFRRGNRLGHDADILYCHEDSRVTMSVAGRLLEALAAAGVVEDQLRRQEDQPGARELRFHRHSQRNTAGKYEYSHDLALTTCRLPVNGRAGGKVVRVDFVGVRWREEWPFATLAWSGTTLFQRELRRWCKKERGWVFNSHGVFDCDTGKRIDLAPACRTEHDVFCAMGLTYLAPYERCC